MLKLNIKRVPDDEDTGYTHVSFDFHVANGDTDKWKALGVFLVAILPLDEAHELVEALEVEMQKRDLK